LKSTPDPERVRTYADSLTRLFALDAEEASREQSARLASGARASDAAR